MIARPTTAATVWWIVAIALSAILLTATGSYARRVATQATRAQKDLEVARVAAQSIMELRAKSPLWLASRREEDKLSPRVAATLSSCGLPSQTLSSFTLQRETGVGGNDVRAVRERAVCTLNDITLTQLGNFVQAWRTREPSWTMTRFELVPISERGPIAGGDIPLRVTLALESLFVNEKAEP